MYITISLFVSFLAIGLGYLALKRRYEYWKIRGVPYPEPTFIFGNTGKAVTLQSRLFDLLHTIYKDYRGFSYVGLFNLWTPAILLRDPEIIKEVLIKEFNSFHNNWVNCEISVDPYLGYNPFVLNDGLWKTIRTQLTPLFTSSKIKSVFPLLEESCKNMIEFIKNKNTSNENNGIDARDLSSRFTADNISSCAYGLDGKSFQVEVPDSFIIGDLIASKSKNVQLKQTISLFLPILRRLFKTTILGDPVPRMFSDLILEAIKYREENNIERNDFLGSIKELKTSSTEITNDILVAHAFTFFLDGFETSALALTYALMELALQPDIQKRAQKEIQIVLEKHNTLTYEAMQEMEYIDNIVSETLRKRPIILILGRRCTENYTLPSPRDNESGEGVTIEKGTHIFIPVYSVQNDSQHYPNPDLFDPNRFQEEIKTSRPKCSFLGFGDGPRICLGRRFAIAQLKMGIISILRKFDLRINQKTKFPLEFDIVHSFNSPKASIMIDFCERSSF